MKKTISILILALLPVCITNAQGVSRSIKAGEWTKTLEKDVTYTLESNGNFIAIKGGVTYLHFFEMPGGLIFSSIDSTTFIDEGVIINGVKWATRNLAAHGKFVGKPEDHGALFQWGRAGDGHEQRTSPNYPTNNISNQNGIVSGSENFDEHGQIVNTHAAYGKFIKQNAFPFDWRTPQNDTLWNSGSEAVPVKTVNDPCPDGWRLPTKTELAMLGDGQWTTTPVSGRYFGSGTNILFLPAAGFHSNLNGALVYVGTHGFYGSSSTNGADASCLYFYDTYLYFLYSSRAAGSSVRCVAEH
ncbi:MAG: fibrobacter succinogenes major paralogous domain-containing protein [Bacteroidetes bacterium]|nr:fibrobacter succinogenes major paralogous domain-containing protein [Bacteroidota bacterium]MCL2301694.1 fibrobacter succinogenes major paralogous domain-containing protein [Lentimicrobiaceae bacterium]